MIIRELIYHKHYWGIPHERESDHRIVRICYDCGKERESPVNLSVHDYAEPARPLKNEWGDLASGQRVRPQKRQNPANFDFLQIIGKRLRLLVTDRQQQDSAATVDGWYRGLRSWVTQLSWSSRWQMVQRFFHKQLLHYDR